jgi:hypothetical protein
MLMLTVFGMIYRMQIFNNPGGTSHVNL